MVADASPAEISLRSSPAWQKEFRNDEYHEEMKKVGKPLRWAEGGDLVNWIDANDKKSLNHNLYLSMRLPVGTLIDVNGRFFEVAEFGDKLGETRDKHSDTTAVRSVERDEYEKTKSIKLNGKKRLEFKLNSLPLSENPQNDYFKDQNFK